MAAVDNEMEPPNGIEWDVPMTKEHKDQLLASKDALKSSLALGKVLDKMASYMTLDFEDLEYITNEMRVRSERVDLFLTALNTKKDKAFWLFLRALAKTGNDHLARKKFPDYTDPRYRAWFDMSDDELRGQARSAGDQTGEPIAMKQENAMDLR